MNPIINFTDPMAILVGIVLFSLLVILARLTKKSFILGFSLFTFLGIIISHTIELVVPGLLGEINTQAFAISIAVDFVFIFLSFFTYLWIDDMEAKENKKKSVDNSLDWFWSKV